MSAVRSLSRRGRYPLFDRRLEFDMLVHHVHIKSADPAASANWWSKAVGLVIQSDELRPEGDRFVRCVSEEGFPVFISGPRPSEQLAAAEPGSRFGLEHIGFHSDDITADIRHLVGLGATLMSGPERLASGKTIAFLHTPDQVRVELVQP
jgi:catechol 2,3-dioxygenase-like lactoylglutathione lyase family enzyme